MIPLLPVWPKSTATFCWSMYFVTRSAWPQFSRMTSTVFGPKPCQETSSVRFLMLTVQPSRFLNTYATTAASASYPTHGFWAMLTVPHGFDDVPPPDGVDGIFDPQAVSAMTPTTAAAATATHLFRIRIQLPLSHQRRPGAGI